ncbi:MAG: single-stranded DNA-binding protein [Candidatus Omnitrophica bacterium]|nr:single-stranded DNA-binding protein [Candidatus Omnitrophota bacterium]
MANLNKVLLMGNLTRDPELRYAPNGTAVTTFSLAMGRVFNSAAGEKKEDVCYVRVVCWAKLAQICGEYLFKGRPVFVEGRLQSRSWQAQDGSKRNTLEVIAQNVQFLGKGKPQDQQTKEFKAEAPGEDIVEGMEGLDNFSLEGKQDEQVPF